MVLLTIDLNASLFHNDFMENSNLDYLKAKAMILMARADNRLFPEEEKELDRFMNSLDLNSAQKKLLNSLRLHSDKADYKHLIDSLKVLRSEDLKILVSDIYRMSLSDKHMDRTEIQFLKSVFIKAGGNSNEWPKLLLKLKNDLKVKQTDL